MRWHLGTSKSLPHLHLLLFRLGFLTQRFFPCCFLLSLVEESVEEAAPRPILIKTVTTQWLNVGKILYFLLYPKNLSFTWQTYFTDDSFNILYSALLAQYYSHSWFRCKYCHLYSYYNVKTLQLLHSRSKWSPNLLKNITYCHITKDIILVSFMNNKLFTNKQLHIAFNYKP